MNVKVLKNVGEVLTGVAYDNPWQTARQLEEIARRLYWEEGDGDHTSRLVYCGEIESLAGKSALVRPSDNDGIVYVQFCKLGRGVDSLGTMAAPQGYEFLMFGWHMMAASDFKESEEI